jgi:hypothetical protein
MTNPQSAVQCNWRPRARIKMMATRQTNMMGESRTRIWRISSRPDSMEISHWIWVGASGNLSHSAWLSRWGLLHPPQRGRKKVARVDRAPLGAREPLDTYFHRCHPGRGGRSVRSCPLSPLPGRNSFRSHSRGFDRSSLHRWLLSFCPAGAQTSPRCKFLVEFTNTGNSARYSPEASGKSAFKRFTSRMKACSRQLNATT